MPTFRRPSAATLVALVVTLAIGTQASLAASSSTNDRSDPRAVSSVEVTAADASSVTIAWPPSRFDWKVAGYGVYVDGAKVATVTPDRVQRWRNTDSLSYTVQGLTCGRGYTIGVDVFDREDDRSEVTSTTVSTSACPDTAAPSPPAGMRQIATTESSVMLAWTPSSDNVGVVEYGLYDSGLRVATVSEPNTTVTNLACGKTYLLGIDAADAAGNRSTRIDSYFRTSACPSTNKPPSTPTGLKIASATQTGLTLGWSPSTDDVAVAGYGVYLSGSKTSETGKTAAGVGGLKCGTTYALGVDAFDGVGLRSSIAQLSAATSPCSTTPPPPTDTGAVTQTIANGQTITDLVNWRGVYDKNGDKVEDDPGKIQFLVDGNLVLSEELIPFGDSFADGSITTSNGTHTFEVRALNDSGTLLAKNTVTATINNQTTPPPPPSSTGAVTQTIANGQTITDLVNWRGVYDKNGDKVEDDPGSIQFLVDGKQALSEINPPFGDSFADGSITTSNGTHTFEVRALNDSGTLLAKNTVTATINNQTTPSPPTAAADTTPPTSPSSLRVVSNAATSVTVSWSPATDNVAVSGYNTYRGASQMGQTAQTRATYNGLSCATAYQLGVDAYDTAGNKSARANMPVTTAACADTSPPSAPANVSVSNRTATSIALTWAPSTDDTAVAGYGIYNAGDLVNTTAGTTGILGNLTCGTNYTLAVDAFDTTGNSSPKTTVMVSTLSCADTTPPSQPTGLKSVSATTSSVTLAWNAATDNVAVAGYDIFRATTKVGSTATTTYAISGLSCGTTYTTGVRAVDSAGNASAQATTSVSTSPCAVQAPAPTTFPDASNTGVPPGTTLTPVSGLTVSTNNAVINAISTTGCVNVEAYGVTIKNSKVGCVRIEQGPGTNPANPRITIQDTEIVCPIGNWNTGIRFNNFNAIRVNIHGCENGLDMISDATIRDSYIHDLACGGSYHTDGIQSGDGSNTVIQHNTIISCDTSAININNTPGGRVTNNVLITENKLAMTNGSYTIYCPITPPTNFRVTNNAFVASPNFGDSTDCTGGEIWSGNFRYATGNPVAP